MNVKSDRDGSVHALDSGKAVCGRAIQDGEWWWATEDELTCEECAKELAA